MARPRKNSWGGRAQVIPPKPPAAARVGPSNSFGFKGSFGSAGHVTPGYTPPAASPPGQPQAPAANSEFTPDAEYLATAAQQQFERTQALSALTSQAGNDKTDTTEALRRMLAKAPEERQGIKQGANKSGLLYSRQLGKQQDTYEADLTQRQGDVQLDFDRREQARAAARAAIEQGAPLEDAANMAASATRQVDRDSTAASANALVPTPMPAARPPRVPAGRRRPPARRRPSSRGRMSG